MAARTYSTSHKAAVLLAVAVALYFGHRAASDAAYARYNADVSITFNREGCAALEGMNLALGPGEREGSCRLDHARLSAETRRDKYLFHVTAGAREFAVAKRLVLWIDSGNVRRILPDE